jgi:hypothetical protein
MALVGTSKLSSTAIDWSKESVTLTVTDAVEVSPDGVWTV